LSGGAVGRTVPPGSTRGPTMGRLSAHHAMRLSARRNTVSPWQSFSPGDTQGAAVEDTIGIPTHRPIGPGDGKIPPRSHNSLIHICPSTTDPGIPIGGPPETISASCRVSGFGAASAGLSAGRNRVAPPLSAHLRCACRPRPNRVRPVVEVNGFEPMTSCLQSRRSPS
jgi:hypothetical protein